MIVNLIVIGTTVLVGAFIAVRLLVPTSRHWFEAPKYRFLENESAHTEQLDHEDDS